MDGSDGGEGTSPKDMSRAGYARTVRSMDERHQRVLANRQHFEPQVHDQISRLFQDYQAPLYARLRGFGRAQTLALAESTVVSLAAVNGRPLADAETQALTEHFLSSVHNLLLWKWTMTGFAAYMTYRGRRTYRFPFFTPEFKMFSPVGGPMGTKVLWHSARFAAYYTTLWLLGEPAFQGANFMRQRAAMARDPRIHSLLHEGRAQGATLFQGGEADNQAAEEGDSAWSRYRAPPPAPSQPQQPSNHWESDDFDDASPVAPAMSDDQSPSGGSAWDRIRQQSQYQPSPRRDQKSWQRPQSGGSWANDVDAGRSPPSESYSFSPPDERNTAKEQAQREFDRLLEKERSGTDQERSSWSKR